MRIGIDVSWAQGPPSGTATYITGLVEALTRVGPEHDYVLLGRSHAGRGAPGRPYPALPGLEAPNVRYRADVGGDFLEGLRRPGIGQVKDPHDIVAGQAVLVRSRIFGLLGRG